MLTKQCVTCEQLYEKPYNLSLKNWGRSKFCSRKCARVTCFSKGHIPWTKGRTGRRGPANNMWKGGQIEKTCLNCSSKFKVDQYRNTATACSPKCSGLLKKGKHPSPSTQFKKGQKPWNFGKPSEYAGEKHHNWQGGITKLSKQIRNSLEYRQWRRNVFKRDDYTCQICKARSRAGKTVVLHADHIKPFARFPELRFQVDNGRTLCFDCHRQTETYLWKSQITILN